MNLRFLPAAREELDAAASHLEDRIGDCGRGVGTLVVCAAEAFRAGGFKQLDRAGISWACLGHTNER